eukprot:9898596-Lingulodinium_polyedra.AAC.1
MPELARQPIGQMQWAGNSPARGPLRNGGPAALKTRVAHGQTVIEMPGIAFEKQQPASARDGQHDHLRQMRILHRGNGARPHQL